MGALKRFALASVLLVAVPVRADPVARWQPVIAEASLRFGIPERWIVRVIQAESGGRTIIDGKPTTSRAGAMGLMQLMPTTWAAMRARLGLGTDPHDPHDNIVAGTAYLRLMYDRFGYPGLFGAYNAGPGRYADHLATGSVLPTETSAYLAKVAGPEMPETRETNVAESRSAKSSTAPDMLFAVRRDALIGGTTLARGDERAAAGSTIFVTLSPR